MTFTKRSATAPAGFFAGEAAGLRWLAQPRVLRGGPAQVVEVREVHADRLVLERLSPVAPTPGAAREFGAALARTHSTGAPAFGFTPQQGPAWFGPLSDPFELPAIVTDDFGDFWAQRLAHVTDLAQPVFSRASQNTDSIQEVIEMVRAGAFNGIAGQGAQAPSRVHGDLWAGNLMWTAGGVVLIDPAAHGGHRLEDLAMLELFGAPHLEEIFSGYEEQYPMPAAWREDLPVHYLFGLLAHVHLFGGSYAQQSVRAAERVLDSRGV